MKKFFTLVSVMLLTASAFAQITLVHSFEGQVHPMIGDGLGLETSYFWRTNEEDNTITIYDSNFSLYKTISIPIPSGYIFSGCLGANYNIFVSNKVGLIVCFQKPSYEATNDYKKFMIIDEEGKVLLEFGNAVNITTILFYMKSTWYMLCWMSVWNDEHTAISMNQTIIYSLPGSGEAADVRDISAPRNNARKYVYKDQVLIDSNNHTYTVTGQEVK